MLNPPAVLAGLLAATAMLFKRGTIRVADPLEPGRYYRFPASNRRVRKRVAKMGSKEPGTVQWLHDNVRPDDIVLDIGANIGIYSVFAAARVSAGHVYSVEPHAGSFAVLLQSICYNGLEERVTPLNIALDARPGWIDFAYNDLLPGSSGSQLSSSPIAVNGAHIVTEQKATLAIDSLLASGWLPAPDIVKIDVDGNELHILQGYAGTACGGHHPFNTGGDRPLVRGGVAGADGRIEISVQPQAPDGKGPTAARQVWLRVALPVQLYLYAGGLIQAALRHHHLALY